MRLLRGVLFGALLWVLIFFEVSILMFGFGLQGGATYYAAHFILAAILVVLCSFWYFRGKTKKGFIEGILVGLVFAVTGIVLDSVITVPLFVHDYVAFFSGIMLMYYLWGVVICGIVGALKK